MHPEDLPTRELADLPGDPVFVRFDRYFPDMWVEGGDEVERFTFTEMSMTVKTSVYARDSLT